MHKHTYMCIYDITISITTPQTADIWQKLSGLDFADYKLSDSSSTQPLFTPVCDTTMPPFTITTLPSPPSPPYHHHHHHLTITTLPS